MNSDNTLKNNDISFMASDLAINELIKMIENENKNKYVRIGVVPGGCSGMSYTMTFEEEKAENDHEIKYTGFSLLIHSDVISYLNGAKLDYKTDLMGGGFYFSNPNASRSCGCGSSFSC